MNKKSNLKKIALLGIAGGVLLAQAQGYARQQQNDSENQYYTADAMESSEESPKKMMTEKDLLSKLDAQTKATYEGLNKEGKALVLKLANQSCKGQNDCKGLNSCKTKENACAGLGGCKGQSKGPFTDANKAVMVAAKHMAEKRLKMMSE